MDPRIEKLGSPEACERFISNARRLNRLDLVEEARMRAVQLRAHTHGATTGAEKECLQAIYAYEEVLSAKNGERTKANRTWQMVNRHEILVAAERAVDRANETQGFSALAEMGLLDYAFEAVILRHRESFSETVIRRSEDRMQAWKNAHAK